ncbi:arabinan endo-1,5-alpha-L-arabinosidase [Hymenobacter luteus]|uniref:Arabinan endo-1,5-alpha-L-arabinosidase n=2 Tax=Hymenobacter TaxID=89966 RepID=A0A7W9T577_9BACT|nr:MULTISPECIES: glycoside hydrolase family 43 protein [Hymenobacter]MBB4602728.1 arabinan endo-1,5-alpha-L-arabinosidase [Hymenobacter latericoloratus]MBB6060619.1 arabinan endo-1,5-alpha-L-arabinosidase [Hymenobacter luteus]
MPKPAATYRNPIWDFDFPDPTIIRATDGYYYAYGTQTKRPGNLIINLQVARSQDLVHWEYLGEGLPQKPVWASTTQKFWAPHVSEHNGIYYLYYSAKPDSGAGLCLAVATSAAPTGPFRDVGAPLQCGTGFLEIDPMAFDDPATGKRLLYWGSGFGALRVRELAEDRLSFAPGSEEIPLLEPAGAGDPRRYDQLLEGSWVVLRHGWYYLFYSGNNCCGPDAHYGVLVARSRAATGPFETLAEATGNPYAMLLEGNEHWLAPGHNCVVTDAAGQDWLAYHAIDLRQPTFDAIDDEQGFSRRVLLLDRLEYVDGWPRLVTGGTPSWQEQEGPVR